MTFGSFTLLMVAIAVGALSQRITGLGFALVTGPIAVLVLGGWEGVLLVNVIGLYVCGTAWWAGRRDVDMRHAVSLSCWGILGVIPGSIFAAEVSPRVLDTTVGLTIILALSGALLNRRPPVVSSRINLAVSGSISGLMNAVSGTPGPPLAAHAATVQMPHRNFVATIQPVFVTLGITTLFAKALTSPSAFVDMRSWQWAFCILVVAASVACGDRIKRYVPDRFARMITYGFAYTAGVSTLGRGIFG